MRERQDHQKEQERRQYERFGFRDDTMVLIGQDSGTILDMSRGGLSVSINFLGSEPVIPARLDIFSADFHFYLPNVPVRVINEKYIASEEVSHLLNSKRFGIEFGRLTSEQEILLNELRKYNPELLDKQRILAVSKCDMLDETMMKQMPESSLP